MQGMTSDLATVTPAVVFGGPAPEHDISILTGLQAARALSRFAPRTVGIYWAKTGRFYEVDPSLEAIDFAEGVPRKAREIGLVADASGGFLRGKKMLPIDVVVNCCHGGPGEDGTLQGALDLAGVPYTGPGPGCAYLAMDKLAFAGLVEAAGMPTLPRVAVTPDTESLPFEGPIVVKPRSGGSSLGIEVVEDLATARALTATAPLLADGAVAEPFLRGGRDLNVAVRTYPSLELSSIERPERAGDTGIYSYAQKYLGGAGGLISSPREVPAQIAAETTDEIRSLARRVAGLIGIRGVARIDFLELEGRVWINEVNTIPGSLSVYLWVDPHLGWERLLADMIAEALRDGPRPFSTAGADGTALRSAASVAAKLGG
jgi:D-alanine-D-alanine ligase